MSPCSRCKALLPRDEATTCHARMRGAIRSMHHGVLTSCALGLVRIDGGDTALRERHTQQAHACASACVHVLPPALWSGRKPRKPRKPPTRHPRDLHTHLLTGAQACAFPPSGLGQEPETDVVRGQGYRVRVGPPGSMHGCSCSCRQLRPGLVRVELVDTRRPEEDRAPRQPAHAARRQQPQQGPPSGLADKQPLLLHGQRIAASLGHVLRHVLWCSGSGALLLWSRRLLLLPPVRAGACHPSSAGAPTSGYSMWAFGVTPDTVWRREGGGWGACWGGETHWVALQGCDWDRAWVLGRGL